MSAREAGAKLLGEDMNVSFGGCGLGMDGWGGGGVHCLPVNSIRPVGPSDAIVGWLVSL